MKTPLVFVHGFLGSSLNWGPVLTRLGGDPNFASLGLEPFAPDMLGHGQRSKIPPDQNLSIEVLGQDLLALLNNQPFFAVGHSFGLRPLLWIAQNHAHLIKGLIVEDSSPQVSEQGFNELIQIFDNIRPPFKEKNMAKLAIEGVFGSDSRMSRFLLTNIRARESDGFYDWRFDAQKLRSLLVDAYLKPQWDAWKSYPGEIEMIMGADSKFVPEDRQHECLNSRPIGKTQIHHINQSGHWVHADQPEEFSRLLLSILKKWSGWLK